MSSCSVLGEIGYVVSQFKCSFIMHSVHCIILKCSCMHVRCVILVGLCESYVCGMQKVIGD